MKITNKFGFALGVLGIIFALAAIVGSLLTSPSMMLIALSFNTIVIGCLVINWSTSSTKTRESKTH